MRRTLYADYKMINAQGDLSLENKIEELLASGVDEILVKPVLMSDGYEAKKLRERVSVYKGRFRKIEFGFPVLGTLENINSFADLLINEIGFSSEFEYCLVGHGSKNGSNREYFELSDVLHSKGILNVEVACLTGEGNINSYLEKAGKKTGQSGGEEPKGIQVYPLLINLGVHIRQDIFGTDDGEEKSFVQILEENGFSVVKNPVPLSRFESFKARYLDENTKLPN